MYNHTRIGGHLAPFKLKSIFYQGTKWEGKASIQFYLSIKWIVSLGFKKMPFIHLISVNLHQGEESHTILITERKRQESPKEIEEKK